MASAFIWGPDESLTSSSTSMTDGSPNPSLLPTSAPDTPMTDQSAPPSPNHLSAAVILATLADSRSPPASQGEDMEGIHDDEPGGILLHEGGAAAVLYQTYTLPAPPITVPVQIDQVLHPMGQSGGLLIDEMLDQHAAALDSLSMEQLSPPVPLEPISSGPTIHDYLMSHGTIYDLDFEADLNPNEEYLNHLNRDRFLSVNAFFRHFVDHRETAIDLDATPRPEVVTRHNLCGDEYDMQGINWSLRRTTRKAIRSKRTLFESVRMSPRLVATRQGIEQTPDTENYFSFKRMNTAHQAFIPHFQLRNLMATTSRNDIFYADRDVVQRTDAAGAPATTVMNLTKEMTEAGKFRITTLAASDDILMAGGFEGEYALTSLSDTIGRPTTVGRIPDRSRDSKSHITNHLHLFESRHNYAPQAVLCSNDERLRVLDCTTNTFIHSFAYPKAVNCSATSPNGRMRVVVGDFHETLITNAETGQPFESLRTHTDDVFACDWADDGIHVATAAQDSSIVVWDARCWARPLAVLFSELSIPRCLKFSPVGGGPKVLVSAEADDYVNVINAQTFDSRQVFDFFGRTAGISMTPDGSSLFVANSEPHFGGIMEFERCGWGERRVVKKWEDERENHTMVDWDLEDDMNHDSRVVCGWHERERRGIDLASLVV